MQGNPEVIDFLNRALRHELTAVNQYWLHYRLLDDWGYAKLAAKQREESIEEMQHADKLVDRIIFLDGFPNMQNLDPLRIGRGARELRVTAAHLNHQLRGAESDADATAAYLRLMELGEQAGDNDKLPPVVGIWGANVILGAVAVITVVRGRGRR